MRLAGKLVSVIVLGIVVLLAVDGYFTVQREVRLFDMDMRRDARVTGETMKDLIVDVWRVAGEARALEMIARADNETHSLRIRWVWLDAPPGDLWRPHASPAQLEPVRRGQELSVTRRAERGRELLCTYIPVAVDPRRPAALELSESLAERDEYTHATVTRVFLLTGAVVLVAALAVFLLGIGMVGRPLHRLIDKTRRVGAGDLSGPLHLHGHDELAELARALNAMCRELAAANERVRAETAARIATLEQLRHADRLTTVGQLASGMAHELGTPLNVVSGRAGLIASGDLSQADIVDSANIIRAQADRMTTLIRQLLDFARRPSPKKESVDLREVTRRTLDLLAAFGSKRQVVLSLVDDDVPAVVTADAGQIQQVLTNLIVNAIQAMPRGGEVKVGIRREHAQPPAGHHGRAGDHVCVYVQDEGQGIPPEHRERLFEPFFTTKDVGEGSGLGLSIAYGIVHEHGGWIGVQSKRGEGSCFSIYLPQEVA